MIKCGVCDNKFPECYYQKVLWSSDTVPCCPVCGVTIYDNNANFTYDEEYPFDN